MLSSSGPINTANDGGTVVRPRRALIIAEWAGLGLQQQLAASGYQTQLATVAAAPNEIREFAPDVVIIELRQSSGLGSHNERLALARHLHTQPATYALPLVFVFDEDEPGLRHAALNVGADDYFGIWTPSAEMLARLDALFWRAEAGRRAVTAAGDHRLEIDNFILLLECVRDEMRAGKQGTLAIVQAAARTGSTTPDRNTRDRTLAEAFGFLKLHLRRIDAVAFYGPNTLLLYLPHMESPAAQAALARLHQEFIAERPGYGLAIGLASFPTHGDEVEAVIEKAEAAAGQAHINTAAERVVAYQPGEMEAQETATQPASPVTAEAKEFREIPTVADHAFPASGFTSRPTHVMEPAELIEPVNTAPPINMESARRDSDTHTNGTEAAPPATTRATSGEHQLRASGDTAPLRLLLTVSDAARLAQLNSLVRSAGYEARAAFDGQQALDLLRIERPDLLLLDYELNGIDGMETLRRLRRLHGGRSNLPVVLLLPSDHEREREEAITLGAQSIINTPYDPAELLKSVRLAGNAD